MISRKPRRKEPLVDIEELIARGGTPAASSDAAVVLKQTEGEAVPRRMKSVLLRIDEELLRLIDKEREREMVPLSRNAWIARALQMRLERRCRRARR